MHAFAGGCRAGFAFLVVRVLLIVRVRVSVRLCMAVMHVAVGTRAAEQPPDFVRRQIGMTSEPGWKP